MNYLKMHGAGNSFVIVENLHGELEGMDLNEACRQVGGQFSRNEIYRAKLRIKKMLEEE